MTLHSAIPILRIFDADLAKAFYVDWLGFKIDWQHQFEPGFPKYLQISRDSTVIHLTEHHGDCCPGAKVLINIGDVAGLHRELTSRPNPKMRPEVEEAPWHAKIMMVIDPFGNRLCFNQPL